MSTGQVIIIFMALISGLVTIGSFIMGQFGFGNSWWAVPAFVGSALVAVAVTLGFLYSIFKLFSSK